MRAFDDWCMGDWVAVHTSLNGATAPLHRLQTTANINEMLKALFFSLLLLLTSINCAFKFKKGQVIPADPKIPARDMWAHYLENDSKKKEAGPILHALFKSPNDNTTALSVLVKHLIGPNAHRTPTSLVEKLIKECVHQGADVDEALFCTTYPELRSLRKALELTQQHHHANARSKYTLYSIASDFTPQTMYQALLIAGDFEKREATIEDLWRFFHKEWEQDCVVSVKAKVMKFLLERFSAAIPNFVILYALNNHIH
jgi:hypothetical protein